jgi:isocitrate dehydrogenase (NAD+)
MAAPGPGRTGTTARFRAARYTSITAGTASDRHGRTAPRCPSVRPTPCQDGLNGPFRRCPKSTSGPDSRGYNPSMPYNVTLIPGDGIGPELATATRRVLDASGVAFDWEVQDAGEGVMAQYGTPLPEHVLESIRRNKVALKGPITTPVGSGFRSVNVTLRQVLGLYANLRPARSMKGLDTRYQDVDLVIVRENTEDLYAGIEHMVGPDAAESIKIITRAASERIARFAFEYAVANGRRKVTAVHKANIMKLSDGLFLESCRTVAAGYDGRIEFEDRIVDNMCMQLVQKPELYDVMVLPNLYGDIVSDLCAGLVGGLGVAPGANIGTEASVFEPVHGSAPKYAGLNKANPTALILSGVLMLRHLGEQAAAERVETALREVIAEGKQVTYDLGGDAGTSGFADAIIARLG